MGRDHVGIVRSACEAWNAGDISIYWELYDPQVVAHGGALWPEARGDVVGPEAMMRNYESIRASFDRSELHLEGWVEGDDVLVAAMLWRGVPHGGGGEVEQRLFVSYRFSDGRIIHQWWFAELAEALHAVDLPPSAGAELTAQIAAQQR